MVRIAPERGLGIGREGGGERGPERRLGVARGLGPELGLRLRRRREQRRRLAGIDGSEGARRRGLEGIDRREVAQGGRLEGKARRGRGLAVVRSVGRQKPREGDGLRVAARARVAFVEEHHDGTLARRGREKAQRRAVLRLERAERTRRRAERAEDDRDPGRADAPGPEELIAQRRVRVAGARETGRRGAARRELALDRVVDRVGEATAERGPDPLELDDDHSRHPEAAALGVALEGAREGEPAGSRRGARRVRGGRGVQLLLRSARLRADLSHPDVVHGVADRAEPVLHRAM